MATHSLMELCEDLIKPYIDNQDDDIKQTLANEVSARTSADITINARIDEIIAPSGEAPSATEVTDARIGANGTVYNSLGTAIRTQVTHLNDAVNHRAPEYIGLALYADIENLYVGGDDFSGEWGNSTYFSKIDNSYNGYYPLMYNNQAQWRGLWKAINVEAGKKYRFLAYVMADSTNMNVVIDASANGNGATASITPNFKSNVFTFDNSTSLQWKLLEFDFECTQAGTVTPCFYTSTASGAFWVCGYKLIEKNGNLYEMIDNLDIQMSLVRNDAQCNKYEMENAVAGNITQWLGISSGQQYYVINKPINKDIYVTDLYYGILSAITDVSKIDSIKIFVGELDQRNWFLNPREIEFTYEILDNNTGYSNVYKILHISVTNRNTIMHSGDVIACFVSCPNIVENLDLWLGVNGSDESYDTTYPIISYTTENDFNSNGFVRKRNAAYFVVDGIELSEVYATKEQLENTDTSLANIANNVTSLNILTDVITGDKYRVVVVDGQLNLKSLNYHKIFSFGNSFTYYPNSEGQLIGWYRNDDDATGVAATIKNTDFIGLIANKLGASVTRVGGVPFAIDYSTDYDFSTLLADLDNTYDCIIVHLGANAQYSATMEDSWVYMFNELRRRAPLADIYATVSWVYGDKATAIANAIQRANVINVYTTDTQVAERNASTMWEGGEYYVGRDNNVYPLIYAVRTHPNDNGFLRMANRFLEAMGSEQIDTLKTITLVQRNGGTISTPNVEWPIGGLVTIRIEAESGYSLSSLNVVDENNNAITTVARSNNLQPDGVTRYYHTFIMPNSDVTVTPTWTT